MNPGSIAAVCTAAAALLSAVAALLRELQTRRQLRQHVTRGSYGVEGAHRGPDPGR